MWVKEKDSFKAGMEKEEQKGNETMEREDWKRERKWMKKTRRKRKEKERSGWKGSISSGGEKSYKFCPGGVCHYSYERSEEFFKIMEEEKKDRNFIFSFWCPWWS